MFTIILLVEVEHCYWQHTLQRNISEHKGSTGYKQTVKEEWIYFNPITLLYLKMQP